MISVKRMFFCIFDQNDGAGMERDDHVKLISRLNRLFCACDYFDMIRINICYRGVLGFYHGASNGVPQQMTAHQWGIFGNGAVRIELDCELGITVLKCLDIGDPSAAKRLFNAINGETCQLDVFAVGQGKWLHKSVDLKMRSIGHELCARLTREVDSDAVRIIGFEHDILRVFGILAVHNGSVRGPSFLGCEQISSGRYDQCRVRIVPQVGHGIRKTRSVVATGELGKRNGFFSHIVTFQE